MDLEEFERQVIADEITEFESYFKEAKDKDDICEMQRICIKNNAYQEKYREWAKQFISDDDRDMQVWLLEKGHCLDILINSNSKAIRRKVVEKDIKYAFDDYIMEYNQDIIIEILMREIEPHAELLDSFLERHDRSWYVHNIEVLEKFLAKVELLNPSLKTIAIQLKCETMTREMMAIEKTMSLKQLWQSGSPFWTEKLTGKKVIDVLRAYMLSEESREEFDIENVIKKVTNSLSERLTRHIPFAKLEKEILYKEPQCHKILTPLNY